MIKLTRAEKPVRLDEATAGELTQKFATSEKSVWNVEYIRNPLLESSQRKCAYCEARIDEESKYMEVDHFRCKRDFPDMVVEWSNLLPACKRCNGRKHDYNVDVEGEIIDPYEVDPGDHLYLDNYRLRWRDEMGRRTIEAVYLNDSERLVRVRLQVGESISEALETIRGNLEDYLSGQQTVLRRNKITSGVERLLLVAQRGAEYSAVAATVLLTDPNFLWIKGRLVDLELWGPLHGLEVSAMELSLQRE